MLLQIIFLALNVSFIQTHNHTIKYVYESKADLYPIVEPFRSGYLDVDSENRLFFEEFGNPNGVPVLIVHGGPGIGCDKLLTCFFDANFYRIIMFDQRGCGRSLPFGELNNNNPVNSTSDIELLRNYLNIDKWIVFGGSYGSLLSILYAETHPDKVLTLILRGIFLGRDKDYENLFSGMSKFFPEAYKTFIEKLNVILNSKYNYINTEIENKDLVKILYKLFTEADPIITKNLSDDFMYYDLLCANLIPNKDQIFNSIKNYPTLNLMKIFLYYSMNQYFLEENQLLKNVGFIKNIPTYIVHGRYDLICPFINAFELYEQMASAQLWIAENAGHSASENSIAYSLKTITDILKKECLDSDRYET